MNLIHILSIKKLFIQIIFDLDKTTGIQTLLLGTRLIQPDLINFPEGSRDIPVMIFSTSRARTREFRLRDRGTYYLNQTYIDNIVHRKDYL